MLGTGEVPIRSWALSGRDGSRIAAGSACSSALHRLHLAVPQPRSRIPSPDPGPDPRLSRPISTTPTRRALLTTPKHFAYVKVAEGCDYTCAFCIIPTLRGKYRSRDARVDRARGASARGARREGAAAHLAGHDVLRHRPRRARRAGAAAARAERDRRPRVDPAALPLPHDDHRRRARGDGGVREGLPLRRPAAAARLGRRAEADAPSGRPPDLRQAARTASATRVPGVTLRTTLIVGFPGETDAGVRRARGLRRATPGSITSASSPTRTRKARAPSRLADDVPAAVKRKRRERADGAAEEDRRRARRRRGSAREVEVLIDGPSPEHELVLQGRLEGQAPDIDPVVFLTDCDPADVQRRRPHPGPDRRRQRLRPARGAGRARRQASMRSYRARTCAQLDTGRRCVLYWLVPASRKVPSGPVPTFCF